jgi:RNA polymerase sigma-32 factor
MSKKIVKTQEIEVLDAEILENEIGEDSSYDSPFEEKEIKQDFVETTTVEADIKQLEILSKLLPVIRKKTDLIPTKSDSYKDPLTQYIKEITKHKLLTIEEEKKLVKQLHETGDIEAAKKLVMANLRLVVKISMEYKTAYKNVMDLIQEGNLGLMKAVSKYNPEKGAKLSYYASWWIKSYVLKFILDNFRLIKIGTTADQKKLFYNLMREKERLQNQGIEPSVSLISENLGVSEKSVKEMDLRLSSAGGEVSIDQRFGDEGSGGSFADFLPSDEAPIDDSLGHLESLDILQDNLHDFIGELKERDKYIFKKRLLSEVPPSLQSIADEYGVSRERIRQIEERLLNKLKVYMSDFLG